MVNKRAIDCRKSLPYLGHLEYLGMTRNGCLADQQLHMKGALQQCHKLPLFPRKPPKVLCIIVCWWHTSALLTSVTFRPIRMATRIKSSEAPSTFATCSVDISCGISTSNFAFPKPAEGTGIWGGGPMTSGVFEDFRSPMCGKNTSPETSSTMLYLPSELYQAIFAAHTCLLIPCFGVRGWKQVQTLSRWIKRISREFSAARLDAFLPSAICRKRQRFQSVPVESSGGRSALAGPCTVK